MNTKVIATGSTGNATLIGSILVDIGVPFSRIAPYEDQIEAVLLTHAHVDHIHTPTLKKLMERHPLVVVVGGDHLKGFCEGVHCVKPDHLYDIGIARIMCTPVPHNAPNVAWHITMDGKRIFYCTDAGNLDDVYARDYDFYFVEANYGEEEIQERIRKKTEAGQYVHEYDAMVNHLSREQATDWLNRNANDKSVITLMHQHVE